MYESFQPDYEGATVFYENLPCQNGNELFVFNAEQYFMNKGVEYSIERDPIVFVLVRLKVYLH